MQSDIQINNVHSANQYLKFLIEEDKNYHSLLPIGEIFSGLLRFNQIVDHQVIKFHDMSLKIHLLATSDSEIYLINFSYLFRMIKKIQILAQERVRSEVEQNLLRIAYKQILKVFAIARNKFLNIDAKEFTVDDIRVLDVVKIRYLSLKQIQALEEWHIQALNNQQLEWLTTCQFIELSPIQIRHLIPSQIHSLSIEKIYSLKREHIQSLSFEQIKILNSQQIQALQIDLLNPEQLLTLVNFKYRYIHPSQLKLLSVEQINKLIEFSELIKFNSFEVIDLLNHLTIKQLREISIKLLSPEMVFLFPKEKFKFLTPSQIRDLSQSQIERINVEKIHQLKWNQLQALSPLQKTWFKNQEATAFRKYYIYHWKAKFIANLN